MIEEGCTRLISEGAFEGGGQIDTKSWEDARMPVSCANGRAAGQVRKRAEEKNRERYKS